MRRLHIVRLVAFVGLLVLKASSASAIPFSQTNLVSNIPGLAALTDANLKNSWGVSFSSSSPIWISNQGTSTANLFTVHGLSVSQNALEVSIPTTVSGPQGPTGQVNNNTSSFPVNGTPASFIFANLNGTISAWKQQRWHDSPDQSDNARCRVHRPRNWE